MTANVVERLSVQNSADALGDFFAGGRFANEKWITFDE